ncbi:MAG: T9SS type A sorting domain-containing protein [Ignavibacteriaceae bacterium]
MKIKIDFILIIVFCLFTSNGISQTFSFVPAHTHLVGQPETDIAFEIPIVNLSHENISVCVVRRGNILPGEWSSSFCFDESCFPPFIDSIATTPDFQSSPIAPGTSVDFSIHVFSDTTAGMGYIQIVAKNMKNLSDSILINLTASNELTSTKDDETAAKQFGVYQNYPNPFNPETVINFYLDNEADITLAIFDVLGNRVQSVMKERRNAGMHSVNFNGSTLASGAYFYRITAKYSDDNIKSYTKKMILEK